ncbi:MAG: DUF2892 domain-containing protein [Leptospiraceae bacterium]|nr:DUF2892 domain-containing protein [Leptospiraceae bacterium]MCB1317286.1 DUF2892 domain-containing protein [Leptospiraceae bacterium]
MYIASRENWYLERVIRLVAGIFALASVALGYFVSPYWFILTALVGINLIIFSLTGFCIMANLLYALGIRPRCE